MTVYSWQHEAVSAITVQLPKEAEYNCYLNGTFLQSFYCITSNIKTLVLGYLFSEAKIQYRQDVTTIDIDANAVRVTIGDRAIKQSRKRDCGAMDIVSRYSLKQIVSQTELQLSALPTTQLILTDFQDISLRSADLSLQNSFYVLIGQSLEQNIPGHNKCLIMNHPLHGHLLSQILRRRIPMILSTVTPTNLCVEIAEAMAMSLLQILPDKTCRVFSFPSRFNELSQ